MLTRIEIDGFKTFRDFSLDVPPFLVMIGRNSSGKSNLFDALQFLSLLADESLLAAAQQIRGDITELFHRHLDGSRVTELRFAVEVLLDRSVTDAFGDTMPVAHSRVRYEVTVGLRESGGRHRPFVIHERAGLIRRRDDRWMRRIEPSEVRRDLAVYSSRPPDLLTTDVSEPGRAKFLIRQQRGSQGRPRELPANEASATVLSSLTTAREFPLLYALKRELQSWRFLHLDPTALSLPDSYDDPDALGPNGAHLPNTLRRITQDTADEDRPDGVISDLSADLAAVIPEVVGITLSEDDQRRQRQVEVTTREEAPFPARVASDGTLRAIALLAALYDPQNGGLICFEEPENGIFPQRLAGFVRHLKSLVDGSIQQRAVDHRAVLRQLILSSHNPTILRALEAHEQAKRIDGVVFVDTATVVTPDGPWSRVTRVRPITTRHPQLPVGPVGVDQVSRAEIEEFEVLQALDLGR